MLQYATLPASLAALLWAVRPCFTAPTFGTFCVLVAGMIAQPGRRTVCGMWVAAGLSRLWHHGRAHWFFARARWSTEQVGLVLAQVIVAGFVPAGAPVLVAVDDTLFRRSGRRVAGAAWQHDGGRKGPRGARVSWGTCFVVAGIVVWLPFLSRPVCLPVAAVLWRSGEGQPKTVLAGQMIHALAARLWAADPGRVIDVVADAHYAGADGAPIRDGCRDRGLPAGVSLTSRLRVRRCQMVCVHGPL